MNKETTLERLVKLDTKLEIVHDIKIDVKELKKTLNRQYTEVEILKNDVHGLKDDHKNLKIQVEGNSKWIQKRDALIGILSATIASVISVFGFKP